MNDFDPPAREYTRPPIPRGVDPQRMNWLWQLILPTTDLDPADVRKALNATGVPATDKRLASWQVTDREENYFPLSIAELERNLRALIACKSQRREDGAEAGKHAEPAGQPESAGPPEPAGRPEPAV